MSGNIRELGSPLPQDPNAAYPLPLSDITDSSKEMPIVFPTGAPAEEVQSASVAKEHTVREIDQEGHDTLQSTAERIDGVSTPLLGEMTKSQEIKAQVKIHGLVEVLHQVITNQLNNPEYYTQDERNEIMATLDTFDWMAEDPEGKTPLQRAAFLGYEAAIDIILERHPSIDINHKNHLGRTALHEAVLGNQKELVSKLVCSRKVQQDAKDNEGNTACHLACIKGDDALLDTLLGYSDVYYDMQNHEGNTPLHLLLSHGHGHKDVCLTYLSAMGQAKKNGLSIQNNEGKTPLHIGALSGKIPAGLIRRSIETDWQVKDHEGQTPLQLLKTLEREQAHDILVGFARRGFSYQLITSAGLGLNVHSVGGETPLMAAASAGKLELVTALLDDPSIDWHATNNNEVTALHYACYGGYIAIYRLLLEKGVGSKVSPEVLAKHPLLIDALRSGDVEMVKEMLNTTTVDFEHLTQEWREQAIPGLVNILLEHHEPEILHALLLTPYALTDENGMLSTSTLLHLAMRQLTTLPESDSDLTTKALTKLFDINLTWDVKDAKGKTPYEVSLSLQNPQFLETLFLSALTKGRLEIVKACLKEEVDLNKGSLKMRPFHLALQAGHVKVALELFRSGKIDVEDWYPTPKYFNDVLGWTTPRGSDAEETFALRDAFQKELMNAKAHSTGTTPLHAIISDVTYHRYQLQTLLKIEGLDWNVKDKLGRTPLHYAFLTDQFNAAEDLLLSGKTDISVLDNREEGWFTSLNDDEKATFTRDLQRIHRKIIKEQLKLRNSTILKELTDAITDKPPHEIRNVILHLSDDEKMMVLFPESAFHRPLISATLNLLSEMVGANDGSITTTIEDDMAALTPVELAIGGAVEDLREKIILLLPAMNLDQQTAVVPILQDQQFVDFLRTCPRKDQRLYLGLATVSQREAFLEYIDLQLSLPLQDLQAKMFVSADLLDKEKADAEKEDAKIAFQNQVYGLTQELSWNKQHFVGLKTQLLNQESSPLLQKMVEEKIEPKIAEIRKLEEQFAILQKAFNKITRKEEEIPEEYLDTITGALMEDPYTQIGTPNTLDKSTWESCNGLSPYTQTPVAFMEGSLEPNTELKAKIEAYKKKHKL